MKLPRNLGRRVSRAVPDMWWQHLINPTVLATPFFIVMVIAEMVFIRVTGRGGTYEVRDTAASLMMGLGSTVVPAFTTAIFLFSVAVWVQPYRFFTIAWSVPALIACF